MSMLRFPVAMLAIAALANATTLQAQETQTKPTPTKPKVAQPNDTQKTQQTPSQQPATQRPDQAHASGDANQQAGVSVKQALIKKLQKANQAEVELATMAQKKTDNPELKQFAKMIVDDHKACNEKLQQLDTKQAANGSQPDSNSEVANAQVRQQAGKNASQGGMVPQQLCQIMDQATDNSLQMAKKMLEKHEGPEFEMAFLRQQCMAHMMMLAELKAIESSGPQELKAFAKETITKVEQHLEKAKQMVKALEGKGNSKKQS